MIKIVLPENHQRSVSSSFYLVEKLADEIESILNNGDNLSFTDFKADLPEAQKVELSKQLQKIKEYLRFIDKKYELSKQELIESRYIRSRKTKIWEVLSNTKPEHLKGFGEFPPDIQPGFEQDLEGLLDLVENL